MTRKDETPKGWAAVPGLGKAPIIEIVVFVIALGAMLVGTISMVFGFLVGLAGVLA